MNGGGLNSAGLNGLASLGQSGLNQLSGLGAGYQAQASQSAYDNLRAASENGAEASKLEAALHESQMIYDRLSKLGDRVFGHTPAAVTSAVSAAVTSDSAPMSRTIERLQSAMRDISQQLNRLERIA